MERQGEIEVFTNFLLNHFKGRRDYFAEGWIHQDGGARYARKPVEGDWTDLIAEHIGGTKTVAVYLLDEGDDVHFGVIDVDTHDPVLLREILRRSDELGIPLLIATSASKGYHLYLLLEGPTPARCVRLLLRHLVEDLDPPVEVFPKQHKLTEQRSFGSCVRLPLQLPLVEQGRCAFVDPASDFQPYSDQGTFLATVQRVSSETVERLVKELGLDEIERPTKPQSQPPPTDPNSTPPCLEIIQRGVAMGARNEAGFALALEYKRQGLSEEEAQTFLLAWNRKNEPPLPEDEVHRTVESAYSGPYQGYPCRIDIIRGLCDQEVCVMSTDPIGTEPFFTREGEALCCEMDELIYRIYAPEEKQGKLSAVIEVWNQGRMLHADKVSFWLDQSRTQFARKVEGFEDELVKRHLLRLGQKLRRFLAAEEKRLIDEGRPSAPPMNEEEKREALNLLRDPLLINRVIDDLSALGYVGERTNKVVAYLVATSRKLGRRESSPDQPMACIIRGESASGKSALVDAVLNLMPPEEVFTVTSFSEKALIYFEKDFLRHKVVVVTERVGAEAADYYLRSLISERKISHAVSVERSSGAGRETVVVELEGPIAYMETTTQATIHLENETRAYELNTDRSEKQTRAIHSLQRHRRTLEGQEGVDSVEAIVDFHRNAQRLLEPANVIIPFANSIEFPASKKNLRLRRDHDRFLNTIAIVAFVHQFQRPRHRRGDISYIEANLEDYRIAYEIVLEILPDSLSDISSGAQEMLETLYRVVEQQDESAESFTFTIADLVKWMSLKQTALRERVKEIRELEFVLLREAEGGKPHKYGLNPQYPNLPPRQLKELLTVEQLRKKLYEEEANPEDDGRTSRDYPFMGP